MEKSILSIISFLYLQCILSITSASVVIKEGEVYKDLSSNLSYFEDSSCKLNIHEIINQGKFLRSEGLLNFGVTTSCYWIKLELSNTSSLEEFQVIIEYPLLDRVSFYEGEILLKSLRETQSIHNRTYGDPNYIFDFNLKIGSTKTFYFEVYSSELLVLPVSLGSHEEMLSYSTLREVLFGIYAGIILVMFFYNFFIYLTVRDISYVYYVIYILLIGLTQASLKGFTGKYLWPDSDILNHYGPTIVSSLSGIAAIEFVKIFLHSKELAPKLHRVSYIVNSLFTLSVFLCLIGNEHDSFNLMQVTTALGSLYVFSMALIILKTGYRPAKFFLAAWGILLIGAVIFVLKDFNVLPFNIYTNYSLQAASVAEIVLLSFALADKINIFRKEKEQSQLEALRALEENERIVREQNVILEAKVEQRTSALKKANEDLNEAMEDLKQTQSKLVSAEKMASLGQLTAGIAHEINNPINFIKSSVSPLKQNLDELHELIEQYENNLNKTGSDESKAIISSFKERIQFDYLVNETQEIIENIEEGANRTVDIVSGLRTFSHVDDMGLKLTDLNKGLQSTLKILLGEIPANLAVNLNLGELNLIECYGGKINQVFMNIINNAIHAIKSKGNEKGVINIQTTDMVDHVRITIEDNGTGIDESIIEKIFDPFFTTKDVGEGTGLGLSVVYGIIESHHGSIDVITELGKGSTFIINLPYIQPK